VSILLLRNSSDKPVVSNLPQDYREAVNWQSRKGNKVLGVVEHIAVAPTYDGLINYLRSANIPQVSATFVIGGDYVGQWAILVGSGLGFTIQKEELLRAANHAGIQSFPNNNPLPQISNPNWWTVGKEHVGYPGQTWTEAMIANDIACNEFIRMVLGDVGFTYVLGHRDFDPIDRANCPGPTFPWSRIYPQRAATLRAEVSPKISVMKSIPQEELEKLPIGDHDAYNRLLKEWETNEKLLRPS
jgi:N-acetyl-anhydromuramyl-L-alanine amidase AmpD